jgi:hypothetical protein
VHWLSGDYAEPLHLDRLPRRFSNFARASLDHRSLCAGFSGSREGAIASRRSRRGAGSFRGQIQRSSSFGTANEPQSIFGDERGRVRICIPRYEGDESDWFRTHRTRSARAAVHAAPHAGVLRDGSGAGDGSELDCMENGALEEIAQNLVGSASRLRIRKPVRLQQNKIKIVKLCKWARGREIDFAYAFTRPRYWRGSLAKPGKTALMSRSPKCFEMISPSTLR